MLLEFTVQNYRSFHEQVTLSMAGYGERIHPDHLIKDPKSGINLLRSALVYGANASGKSNLVKAVSFFRDYIIDGRDKDEPINCPPFRFADPQTQTVFGIAVKIDHAYYRYEVAIVKDRVEEERLFKSGAGKEQLMYERLTDEAGIAHLKLGRTFKAQFDLEDRRFLEYVARGTRPNTLFLTESQERNFSELGFFYKWFLEKLWVMTPDFRSSSLELQIREDLDLATFMNRFTRAADMGIAGLEIEEIEIDLGRSPGHESYKMMHHPKDPTGMTYYSNGTGRFTMRGNPAQSVVISELITKHHNPVTGAVLPFDLKDESDGTRRFIDLLPAFYRLSTTPGMVFIIDELGRNLHPDLLAFLCFYHLEQNPNKQAQLVFTTHHPSLLSLKRLRRGEIWFTEKKQDGASDLYSLLEFPNTRYDKDIQAAYRQGRFGATPRIAKHLVAVEA